MLRRGRSVVVVFVPLSSVNQQTDEQQAQRSGDDENADEDADHRGAVLLFLRQLVGIYALSGETMELAITLVTIHAGCAIIFWPLSFVLPNAPVSYTHLRAHET